VSHEHEASGASTSNACSLERILCSYIDEGLNGLEEEGREEREEANNQRSDPICTKRSSCSWRSTQK
jgi:hypothetical protein